MLSVCRPLRFRSAEEHHEYHGTRSPVAALAAVPTLSELQADPAQLETLPLDVLVALRRQLRHLDADLEAIITRRLALPSPTAQPAGPDRLLTVKEMMALAQVTRTWLYRHADQLPFTRRLSKKAMRFSEAGARRWLASRRP